MRHLRVRIWTVDVLTDAYPTAGSRKLAGRCQRRPFAIAAMVHFSPDDHWMSLPFQVDGTKTSRSGGATRGRAVMLRGPHIPPSPGRRFPMHRRNRDEQA